MADDSWIVLWFSITPWYEPIIRLLTETGFQPNPQPAVWVKRGGQVNNPHLSLASSYETFVYARKGNAVIAKPGRLNTYDYKPVDPSQKWHPTQRPIGLMEDLLATFGDAGSRVFVPFAGSGVTLLAAFDLGMTPFGYDINQSYKDGFVAAAMQATPGHYDELGI